MARLSHPNVVRIYGGCMSPPNLFVVSELMVGDLCTHIHRRGVGKAPVQLSLTAVLSLALDIIRGLVYLHSLDIIHRWVEECGHVCACACAGGVLAQGCSDALGSQVVIMVMVTMGRR
jgi:hypothetical protein